MTDGIRMPHRIPDKKIHVLYWVPSEFIP